jgi:hypothetical protein
MLGFKQAVKPALIATTVAMTLALVTSLTLAATKLNAVHTKNALAMLLFALYLLYGLYFTAGGWLRGDLRE